jgi:hypothetical protein
MSLNWNLEQIRNYETVCWIRNEETGERERMNPVTEALIFNSMAIGIGRITADNAAEVYARTSILEGINGALLHKRGEPVMITFDDISAHVGLWCNVSFESRKEWAMRWFVGHGDYLIRYGEKRKSRDEIDAIEDRKDSVDVSRTEDLARQYRRHIKQKVLATVEADPELRKLA